MAYTGLGLTQKPTLEGIKEAGLALAGGVGATITGVGGLALGGAGLVAGSLANAFGATATPYLVGLGAMGAAGKKGFNMFDRSSDDNTIKKDTATPELQQEMSKQTQYGLLSLDKLDDIHKDLAETRSILVVQDPASQAREEALDEQTKNKELVSTIMGIGKGVDSGGKGKEKSLLEKLLPLIGLTALTAALPKFLEDFDKWSNTISEAVDNISEFLNDLDNFFEGMGIEFGGPAALGAIRGAKTATRRTQRKLRTPRGGLSRGTGTRRARPTSKETRKRYQRIYGSDAARNRFQGQVRNPRGGLERGTGTRSARPTSTPKRGGPRRLALKSLALPPPKPPKSKRPSKINSTQFLLDSKPQPVSPEIKPTTSTPKRGGRVKQGFQKAFDIARFKNLPRSASSSYMASVDPAQRGKAWSKIAALDKWLATNKVAQAVLKPFAKAAWFISAAFAAYDISELISQWLKNKSEGNDWPFAGDEPEDKVFVDGLKKMAGTYGGAYLGAIAGGMIGSLIPVPFVGTVAGSIVGGLAGSMLGESLAGGIQGTDRLNKIKAEKKGILMELNSEFSPEDSMNGRDEQLIQRLEAIDEEIKVLESGPTDEASTVVIVNNVDNTQNVNSATSTTTNTTNTENKVPMQIYGEEDMSYMSP